MAISLPFGVIFLADPTGVTAGSNEVFENDLSSLDTYSAGRGYGYVAGGTYNPRTRNTSLDRRLVGTHWTAANTQAVYRVDLPATGSYTIRTASGDASGGASVYLELFDGISAGVGVTSKGVLSTGSTSNAAAFKDATDVERATPSAWVSNNAAITATFATTELVLHIGNGLAGGAGNGGSISYFYIESSAPAGTLISGGVGVAAASGLPAEVAPAGLSLNTSTYEFGQRTGLDIEDFALYAAQSLCINVFADDVNMAAPILSYVETTGTNGRLTRKVDPALVLGAWYMVAVWTNDGTKLGGLFRIQAT